MVALKDALSKYLGSFVCSLHFYQSDILMKQINGKTYVKLKEVAMPRLMLPNDDSAIDVGVLNWLRKKTLNKFVITLHITHLEMLNLKK